MNDSGTRAVIDRYFALMGQGEDFATCYSPDVCWMTFDGGTTISGSANVRDYLVALHNNMPDIRTRPLAYADETAFVEGDCADPRSEQADRLAFCIAYEVENGLITSARCYGAVGFLAPTSSGGDAA